MYATGTDELMMKMIEVDSKISSLENSDSSFSALTIGKASFEMNQIKKSLLEINEINDRNNDKVNKIYDKQQNKLNDFNLNYGHISNTNIEILVLIHLKSCQILKIL